MEHAERRSRRSVAAVLVGLPLLLGTGLAAEPEPTPTPAATRTPIVISNENLADYAAQGHLTSVETTSGGGAGAAARRPVHRDGTDPNVRVTDAVADAASVAEEEKRQYWTRRYQQQLELVASIEEQITILDREIPGLWRDFYAWDDPAYRDGVIKVQLDASLARSERLKTQLEVEKQQVKNIQNEARKAGASPGWFRGIAPPTPTPTPGN
jgi:hypothetical protein